MSVRRPQGLLRVSDAAFAVTEQQMASWVSEMDEPTPAAGRVVLDGEIRCSQSKLRSGDGKATLGS